MIEFKSVEKRYGSTLAVENFSLQLPSHKTTVFVGPSGCGKTTLLRMINRMVEPTKGGVEIDGIPVSSGSPVQLRRSIGYVLQNGGLLPHLKVIDNVTSVLRLQKTPRSGAAERARQMMELVGLDPSVGDRYPAQLSGGQQQRVGVARALAPDPNILLMDEPFAAVDPVVRAELQAEVIRLQSELSKTVVFVTHDIDEAFKLGDQIVILGEGAKIHQAGTADEIIASPADNFVRDFVGLTNGSREFRLEGGIVKDATGRTRGVVLE